MFRVAVALERVCRILFETPWVRLEIRPVHGLGLEQPRPDDLNRPVGVDECLLPTAGTGVIEGISLSPQEHPRGRDRHLLWPLWRHSRSNRCLTLSVVGRGC